MKPVCSTIASTISAMDSSVLYPVETQGETYIDIFPATALYIGKLIHRHDMPRSDCA